MGITFNKGVCLDCLSLFYSLLKPTPKWRLLEASRLKNHRIFVGVFLVCRTQIPPPLHNCCRGKKTLLSPQLMQELPLEGTWEGVHCSYGSWHRSQILFQKVVTQTVFCLWGHLGTLASSTLRITVCSHLDGMVMYQFKLSAALVLAVKLEETGGCSDCCCLVWKPEPPASFAQSCAIFFSYKVNFYSPLRELVRCLESACSFSVTNESDK